MKRDVLPPGSSTFPETGTDKKYDVCESLKGKEYAEQRPGVAGEPAVARQRRAIDEPSDENHDGLDDKVPGRKAIKL